jgi:hypothetical protein
MLSRTAKSCGPDAPTLASSSRRFVGPTGRGHSIFADDGGKRARSPGRARHTPLKPLRRECRVFRRTCGDYARVLPTHCTRGCGCSGHPAFPAPSNGAKDSMQQLGRIAPRGAKSYADVIASEAKQSIFLFVCDMDCFAEPVIGRRFAPTRWLAMTVSRFGCFKIDMNPSQFIQCERAARCVVPAQAGTHTPCR